MSGDFESQHIVEGPVLQIVTVTDPMCVWCWGSYPLLRTLGWRYGDSIQLDDWMGGMVPDIRETMEPRKGLEGLGRIEALNQTLAYYWERSVKKHGMPVNAAKFALFDEDNPSGWPICEAVGAAGLQGDLQGQRMNRRLREGIYLYGEKVNRLSVQIELAEQCGLDIGAFVMAMKDGSAGRVFRNDVQNAIDFNVQVFPTWIVRDRAENTTVLEGVQTWDALVEVIDKMTDGRLVRKKPIANSQEVLRFLRRYGNAADEELIQALDYEPSALQDDLAEMERNNQITIERFGQKMLISEA
ncbi:MAG: DsbA family oxidoreductase [Fastidiosipilaceae bacterium]|jgi:putative protein-disulfide isomerase